MVDLQVGAWLVGILVLCFLVALLLLSPRHALRRRKSPDQQLINRGRRAYEEAGYAEAEAYHRVELARRERDFGPDSPRTGLVLNSLGMALHAQAKNDEAESAFRRALAAFKGVSAKLDGDVAATLTNLGNLLKDTGRADESLLCQRSALSKFESTLGPDHPKVATVLSNLASTLLVTGGYEEAEGHLRRSLAIHEAKDASQPYGAALNNLGEVLRRLGRLDESAEAFQRSLDLQERLKGPDHPLVLSIRNNLATLMQQQGQLDEALAMFDRNLASFEKIHGPDHPQVANASHNLAVALMRGARFEEAEQHYRRALEIWGRNLGPESAQAARSLANLGILEMTRGRFAESESLLKQALAIKETALGLAHHETGETSGGLARLYLRWGRYDEAASSARRSLETIVLSLGAEHIKAAFVRNVFARVLVKQGRYDEAEPVYLAALPDAESASDPLLWSSIQHGLGELHRLRGDLATGDACLRRSLVSFEARPGIDEVSFASLLHELALLRRDQEKPCEAAAFARRALEIRGRLLGGDHPDSASSRSLLGELDGS